MRVYGRCKKCGTDIAFSTYTNTRVEFAMKNGENKQSSCKHCNKDNNFHVDELYASRSKMPLILSIATFMIVLILNLYFLLTTEMRYIYLISLVLPFIIYLIMDQQDQTRVASFNKRNLKGRTHNF